MELAETDFREAMALAQNGSLFRILSEPCTQRSGAASITPA
jgi:hypothetical protein